MSLISEPNPECLTDREITVLEKFLRRSYSTNIFVCLATPFERSFATYLRVIKDVEFGKFDQRRETFSYFVVGAYLVFAEEEISRATFYAVCNDIQKLEVCCFHLQLHRDC